MNHASSRGTSKGVSITKTDADGQCAEERIFVAVNGEPYIIYDYKIVYKAHTPAHTYRYIHESYMRTVGLMYAVRANKPDRNLTDQISGQSFDDHVEQFNSRSPLRPAAFTRAISLAVGCVHLAADSSLFLRRQQFYSPICGPNFWQSPSSYILFDPRAYTRGAKSPA